MVLDIVNRAGSLSGKAMDSHSETDPLKSRSGQSLQAYVSMNLLFIHDGVFPDSFQFVTHLSP
jgi:hypothetical protein